MSIAHTVALAVIVANLYFLGFLAIVLLAGCDDSGGGGGPPLSTRCPVPDAFDQPASRNDALQRVAPFIEFGYLGPKPYSTSCTAGFELEDSCLLSLDECEVEVEGPPVALSRDGGPLPPDSGVIDSADAIIRVANISVVDSYIDEVTGSSPCVEIRAIRSNGTGSTAVPYIVPKQSVLDFALLRTTDEPCESEFVWITDAYIGESEYGVRTFTLSWR